MQSLEVLFPFHHFKRFNCPLRLERTLLSFRREMQAVNTPEDHSGVAVFFIFRCFGAEGGPATMPKQKSHKASRKRFRVTATGKLKRSQAGKKHLNTHKSRNRKRRLRGGLVTDTAIAKKYVKALLGVS